jgi:hypothetical protein
MSHSHLTRWIEDADARRFAESALFERRLAVSDPHPRSLGGAISQLPAWLNAHLRRPTTRPTR